MEFFTTIHEGTNYSKRLKDFGTASVSLELQTGQFIYVGYRKPFKQFFVELSTKNTVANTMTAEYYDGTTWQPLNTLIDESEGFTKSGFFLFDRPGNWAATTVAPETDAKFFIRILTNANHSVGTEVQGLAILLSNDLDLEAKRSNIVTKLNNNASWVLKHEQARKHIIQLLRNRGNRIVKKVNGNNNLGIESGVRYCDVTEFDLLEPEQLRQASACKAMADIYLNELTDTADDKWQTQGERLDGEFSKMFNLFYLQLDIDDDGESDNNETVISTSTALSWR